MDTYFLEYLIKARQQDLEKDFGHIHLVRAFPGSKQRKFRKLIKGIGAILFPVRFRNRDHRRSADKSSVRNTNTCSSNRECCPSCMN